jgi:hypothetical protein
LERQYLADFVGGMTSCVILSPYQLRLLFPGFRANCRVGRDICSPKKQREQRISPLLPACTLPQVLRQINLLQLAPAGAGRPRNCRGASLRREEVNYAVFVGAKAAHTSLVECCGRGAGGVALVRHSA